MKQIKQLCSVLAVAALLIAPGSLWAGAVIIDGTDANDHGSAGSGGWLYMSAALSNLAASVGGAATNVTIVGHVGGGALTSTAAAAIAWAVGDALPGWTTSVVGADDLSSVNLSNTGILYVTTSDNASGDLNSTDQAALNTQAALIAGFVASGGELFAQGESATGAYGWLTALIPTITVNNCGGGGCSTGLGLTADGTAAFPGLTNAQLSTGPWHDYFTGSLGSLKALALGNAGDAFNGSVVVIGGGSETVIATPEPGSVLLLGSGLLGLGYVARKRRNRKTA